MNIKVLIVQFIKFGLVGFLTTVISYAVYALLVYMGFPYIAANIVGFIIGTLNSFIWNSLFVFKKQQDEKRNPWWTLVKTFVTYGCSNLLLSSLLLWILVEKFGLSEYIAPILVLCVTVPLNFVVNKFWSYKKIKMES